MLKNIADLDLWYKYTVKAPNIAHLSLLTSIGYIIRKKQNWKSVHSQIK